MPQEFARNGAPAYYARPSAFRCTIGAAALGPAVPTAAALGGAQATGTIGFSAQPGDGSTITVCGLPITFAANTGFDLKTQAPGGVVLSVAGVPLPFQAVAPTGLTVKIGASLAATLANLLGLLRSWPDYVLAPAHFTLSGNALAIQARDPGTTGNALTIAASGASNGTASGATLSGGTALASGVGCLVPIQNHPVDIESLYVIGRGNVAAGTVQLGLTDGANVTLADWLTIASQPTISATQGNTRLPFPNTTSTTPLRIPAGVALVAWSTVQQALDVVAPAGGVY